MKEIESEKEKIHCYETRDPSSRYMDVDERDIKIECPWEKEDKEDN